MGGQQIDCPLCCDKTFDSKQSLYDHLNNVMDNLYCPICNSKLATLEALTEHLSLYNCSNVQTDSAQNIVIYEQSIGVENIEDSESIKCEGDMKEIADEFNSADANIEYITEQTYETHGDTGDVNKMYVELISSKQASKPLLQTGELKLIKGKGEGRYMIVTSDNGELQANTVVTKQNNDGTISLTTVNDIKLESETLIAPEADSSNNQQETYNCNACKVSFTSVMEHIQNYHNDQEVVVQDIAGVVEQDGLTEYDTIDGVEGPTSSDKQAPRRVITDTGDIVEEPVIFKADNANIAQDTIDKIVKHPKLVLDKQGRAYTRRYVQIDKLENVSSPSTISEKKETCHNVITKDVPTKSGFTVKMHHCMSCNITASTLEEFQTQPCKTLKYPCSRCPAAYENSKSLCAHMKVHKVRSDGTTDVPITYECEVCCTVFPTNKSLKLHKRMHDPVKARPIEPPIENSDGKDTIQNVYCCDICEKMIPTDYRTIHENSHKTSDKMNCSICNKKFSSLEYLQMHMNVHNLDKVTVDKEDSSLPYKCLYCNRRFARPHEKVKHERIHTGEKPHSCEICGKSFRVSYCLTLHMRTHTGARPYACPHCGKRFKAHSVYNHHLLTHSEVRAYKCPFCPKAFKTSVQLAGHKNSHTKPFSCQHCNRPFASLYAVRVHSETHARQNNLKYACALCGASYARAFALKDHVKHAHHQDLHAPDTIHQGNQEEYWMTRETDDTTESLKESLDKELQEDITELEMHTNELIVP